VRFAVCLEHGCEKTHNDHFSEAIEAEVQISKLFSTVLRIY
jgi:hypothetical protein